MQPDAAKRRHTDVFKIASGGLGPLPACEFAIKPLTVFVGRQGTGKSLVAQTLYFFEELPFLSAYIEASERKAQPRAPEVVVRRLLDQLRSHERAFGTFANTRVRVEWTRSKPFILDGKSHRAAFKFTADARNRVISPDRKLREFVSAVQTSGDSPRRRAVFFPTERLVISQLRSALAERVLALPITYTLFSDWMDLASRALSGMHKGAMTPEHAWIERKGNEALSGDVFRRGEQWKWRFGETKGQVFDLDMASSGQRANWSIVYLAKALFMMRGSLEIANTLTLFVEEPEIHLHPAAQVAMLEILAFLVRHGFRVVMTTHSMNVIYALNNLIQASRLGDLFVEGAPAPEVRLQPSDVAVYDFAPQGPRLIVDDTGFIDESVLGEVAEELTASMNTIGANLPPVGVEL